LLALFATKAQMPFTGTVTYKMDVGPAEAAPPHFTVHYHKHYLLLEAMGNHGLQEQLVMDYTTGKVYEIAHYKKKVTQREFPGLGNYHVQTAGPAIDSGRIAGIAAKGYKAKISGKTDCIVWLADSLPLAAPDDMKKSEAFSLWSMDRVMLHLSIQADTRGYQAAMDIKAIQVTPAPPSDSLFQLPKDYAFTDEAALRRREDSLMRAFKQTDSLLGGHNLEQDSLPAGFHKMDSMLRANGMMLDPVTMQVKSLPKEPKPAKPKKKGPARPKAPARSRKNQ
jgi:hypothetical protein